MKKIIFIFIICYCTFVIDNCFCQWQPDVRLTNDVAGSITALNNTYCVAAFGNVVHTVWHDNRDANVEIYYKRSSNGGLNWGTDTRLTNNTNVSTSPCITVSVAASGIINIHVLWYDNRDGNYEVYYKSSTDGGLSWGLDIRLTNSSGDSFNPAIAVVNIVGETLHLVWHDYRDGNAEIYYKRSTNGGINWGQDLRLTSNTGNSFTPAVAFSGSVVHTSWLDDRDGNYEIYYKRSTDDGISWGTDTRLTNQTANSQLVSLAVSGSIVHAVWRDSRDGNTEIYYKRSSDGGINWGADTRLTNNSAISDYPSLAVSGSIVYITWDDNRDGNNEIYYNRSSDGGLNWAGETRLTFSTGVSDRPSVALYGQVVHIVWPDNRDGNYEIYYKLNPTGTNVGISNLNSEIPNEFSLSQNYPNPFNPTTKIRFEIPLSRGVSGAAGRGVSLVIYDMLGREIATLVNEEFKPGTYEINWDASNFVSGVYFYKLSTTDFTETKKMVLIK